MKASLILFLIAFVFVTCSSQSSRGPKVNADGSWDIVLKGKVTNPGVGKIFIRELRHDESGWTDSITLAKDNTFEKKIRVKDAGYYAMNFYDRQMFNIVLYKNDITLNVDVNAEGTKPEIIGSPEHDLIKHVSDMISAAQRSPEMEALKTEFETVGKTGDTVKIAALQQRYSAIVKRENDKIAAWLLKQPANLSTIELLSRGQLLPLAEYENVYLDAAEKLSKTMPNSEYVKPFLKAMEKGKTVAVGHVAPEIEMPDPSGKVIKLSSLRGKYVLVDFWAQWCGPCRRENPNVVKAYHRFKDKGFEVFGVSLDREKKDWVRAIQEDGLVWTQVSDLKYFLSKAAQDYNVESIPFSILLDPKGIIVAKNLRGEALEAKLAELLGK